MTDVRQILLNAMMSERAPAAPGSNQAKVDEIAREVNGRIVDHFLDILKRAKLRVVSDEPTETVSAAQEVGKGRGHYKALT